MVITLSRRYCAGASVIADDLSRLLCLPVYGKDYICRNVHNPDSLKEQADIIKELAEQPCIIVGRGASEVLRGQDDVVNIFVYADKEDRIKRAMKKEGITRPEAEKRVEEVDKERIHFFEANTGKYWGDFDNYDIILDTSKHGIDNCANIIINWLRYYDYI